MITLDDVSIRYRGPALLDGVSARINRGDRIGLLGRNGAGKTTLLKLLDGREQPDHGRIAVPADVRIARLIQDVPRDVTGTVIDLVVDHAAANDPRPSWERETAAERAIGRMELAPEDRFETLSSGMKRRVLLAGAIASEPDVLLLDEPTNHLDIGSILWLENFLSQWRGTLVFITHDRSFLQTLADRIWEIDRGRLFDWACDYPTFLQRKEAALAAEEKQNALFDKKLAEEEAWIRQGIKARRTRNEGRVRALKALRETRAERRTGEGKAKLNLQNAARGGALVAKLDDVAFGYDDRTIVHDFSTLIMRGDKIGIVGKNGAGKTTLLKLILGQLKPTAGDVRLGTNLKIAYFDQLRDTLDPEMTVAENVGEGGDTIRIGDVQKHIYGYLQDYLFSPERARTQVKFLSGGERNRALLAKLMTRPANVIVLDEPTNDLDAETLELLEEQLVAFDGTVLMVSHDRTFLNNVVTGTLVFEDGFADGTVNEYVGGYDDWMAAKKRRESAAANAPPAVSQPAPASKPSPASNAAPASNPDVKKLSYKDQRELDGLPARIESLEAKIAAIHAEMAKPAFYQSGGDAIAAKARELETLQADLQNAMTRWEVLESA